MTYISPMPTPYAYGQTHALQTYGLVKEATVPGAVKQYRRALESLRQNPRPESAFHGTRAEHFAGIANRGALLEDVGAHGTGVYLWGRMPLQMNMRTPADAGFIIPHGANRGLAAMRVSPTADPYSREMLLHPGDLKLPHGSSAVAPTHALRANRDALTKNRLRQIDAGIFHRAEADVRVRNISPSDVRRPTRRELEALQRAPPPAFQTMRAPTEDGRENFLSDYLSKTRTDSATPSSKV